MDGTELANQTLEPSFALLKDRFTAGRMFLLNPESHYRTAFLSELISDPFCPLYYFCLGAEDQTLVQVLTSLANTLALQNPLFGQNIVRARIHTPDEIDLLAEALATDLNVLCDEHYILILDDFDRTDDILEMRHFVETLLNYLPPQCHLMINSRTEMPQYAWPALIARGYIQIVNLPA